MKLETAIEFVAFARRVAEEEAAWADWHNIVFGSEGQFSKMFPTQEEREEFFDSAYAVQIEKIESALRKGSSITEYTRPVTTSSGKFVVRIPKSLHEALTVEARAEGVSLNQLVLSKLTISLATFAERLNSGKNSLCAN